MDMKNTSNREGFPNDVKLVIMADGQRNGNPGPGAVVVHQVHVGFGQRVIRIVQGSEVVLERSGADPIEIWVHG